MDFLLLVSVAGALAWVWDRMEALERRVAGLEASAFVPDYTRAAEPEVVPPPADTAQWDPWPEHTEQPEVPAIADPAHSPDPESIEEPDDTEDTFAITASGFRPS